MPTARARHRGSDEGHKPKASSPAQSKAESFFGERGLSESEPSKQETGRSTFFSCFDLVLAGRRTLLAFAGEREMICIKSIKRQ